MARRWCDAIPRVNVEREFEVIGDNSFDVNNRDVDSEFDVNVKSEYEEENESEVVGN